MKSNLPLFSFLLLSLLFQQSFAQLITKETPPGKQAIPLDWISIKQIADQAPHESLSYPDSQLPVIQLPDESGNMHTYVVQESPIMSDDFAQQYPDMHTYSLRHVSDPLKTGRMLTTTAYIHVVLLDRGHMYLIQPDDLTDPRTYSIGSFEEEEATLSGISDGCEQAINRYAIPNPSNRNSGGFTNDTRRTYRLAIVTTGEFHDGNGGTVAAATAVVTASVNAIQAIFDRELSIRFTLLTPVVYTDYTTDPFDPAGSSRPVQAAEAVALNFASSVYDIGHVFHDSNQPPAAFGGGGVAYLNAVCRTIPIGTGLIKGGGWSGSSNNATTGWYRLASHEFGHMYGANHTFNGSGSNCNSSNINSSTSYEIGSGTTIMSYRGICGAGQNIPSSGTADDYFHANSLDEMILYINGSGACATNTSTGNSAPVGNANPTATTYTIPGETPFTLTGSATDADGDVIYYGWEQDDEDGTGTPTQGFLGATAAASAIAPLFRSYPPTYFSFPHLPRIE